MNIPDTLRKAKEILKDRGWTGDTGDSGLMGDSEGRLCILGAVGVAIAGNEFDTGDYCFFKDEFPGDVAESLAWEVPPQYIELTDCEHPYQILYEYNDASDLDSVLEIIDKAIAKETAR
jgi:hypothetical protein